MVTAHKLGATTPALNSCKTPKAPTNPSTSEAITTTNSSVVINGVMWATHNVATPGTFTAKPKNIGMLYQWNRKVGWSTTSPMLNSNGGTTWGNSMPTGTTWTGANNPCPAGWRVPTTKEQQSLLNAGGERANVNGIEGYKFGVVPNTLFLPAAG